jgi:N-acylneuraminate cytidylyltransferase/CMP-N,N'-diacetyllegionaminic acid synthase
LRILAIIPARGGSKGIVNKNITLVNGKPLIEFTIAQALELKKEGIISEAIVSTDSVEISLLAKSLGGTVPFLRPNKISKDNSKTIDTIIHALDFYKKINIFFDSVILLQPTSPLRSFNILKESITTFKNSGKDSLISCFKEDYININVMYKLSHTEDNVLVPKNTNHNKGKRRQDHQPVFIRNGAIYITKVDYLYKFNEIISNTPAYILMDKKSSINIDTQEDLDYLNYILC